MSGSRHKVVPITDRVIEMKILPATSHNRMQAAWSVPRRPGGVGGGWT